MNKFVESFLNPVPKQCKKVLFVIGGITYKNYAIGDLLTHPSAGKYQVPSFDLNDSLTALGNENTKYDLIKEINCEKLLDGKELKFIDKLFLLGMPFRLWDRFGDYFKLLFNKPLMHSVTNLVESEVNEIRKKYGHDTQIDFIAHSLGTLILLASKVQANTVYLLGSPLTSKFWSIRSTANSFFKNNSRLLANQIIFAFSQNDIVGTKPASSNILFANNIDCTPLDHSFLGYINYLINLFVIKL